MNSGIKDDLTYNIKGCAMILLATICFCSCKNGKSKIAPQIVIAFGSCNDEDNPQDIWKHISKERANLWVWLGDNIYGDSDDMNVLRQKYAKQNAHPEYAKFKKPIKINGTWDDHDYGVNDGGKEYPSRAQSQQAFLDFMDVSEDDPRRTRAGIYGSQNLSSGSINVKLLYLDTRYFRDRLEGSAGEYGPTSKGTILGEDQWKWLEKELKNSQADIHVIVSSIQVLSEEHGWEKWANFPHERKRLLDLISKHEITHPIILSGDRHAAEISQQEWKGTRICDITSSGLTHVTKPRSEINRHRIQGSELEFTRNYGTLEIADVDGNLNIVAKIKTAYNAIAIQHAITGDDL